MVHIQQLVLGPVEVIGQVGQFLVQPLLGVQGYAPTGAISSPGSTSNSVLQLGQAT